MPASIELAKADITRSPSTRSSTRPTKRCSWARAWPERSACAAARRSRRSATRSATAPTGEAVVTSAGNLPAALDHSRGRPGLAGRRVRRRDAARLGGSRGPAPRAEEIGAGVGRAAGDLDGHLRFPARQGGGDLDRRRAILRGDGRRRSSGSSSAFSTTDVSRPSRRRSSRANRRGDGPAGLLYDRRDADGRRSLCS